MQQAASRSPSAENLKSQEKPPPFRFPMDLEGGFCFVLWSLGLICKMTEKRISPCLLSLRLLKEVARLSAKAVARRAPPCGEMQGRV